LGQAAHLVGLKCCSHRSWWRWQMLRLSCICTSSTAQRPATCWYCSSLSIRRVPPQPESAGPPQTHHVCEETHSRANRTADSAAHEQHTHAVRRIYTQASPFTSTAGEMPNPLLAPCVFCTAADLASGRHADALFVCASFCGVSRSIHPPHAVLALLDRCAPLAAERNPKRP
jgi:hypothetical protein